MHTILPQFEPLMEATTKDEVMLHVSQAIKFLEFERFLFAVVPKPKTEDPGLFLHSTYPEEWRNYYDRHSLSSNDPTVAHCFKAMSPFIWQPESFQTIEQKNLYEEASSFGLRTGVTLPIHGISGEVGMLTCVRDEIPGKKFQQDFKHNLSSLTLLRDIICDAMNAYITVEDTLETGPQLTIRELDCLRWIALGKTTWEISRILNISEAGVNFHISNLRNKFGVNRRNDVVIKAIKLGIITLP
ncbi:LuxR family transcriptional regulator [Mixta theicola]|uniref:LuxR family transcriptional regulator n=1 Tax=Mixta theicola TaxID=1458355 RepID=A0A2K1Q7T6_9GAMM|nr:autoinducer binding domain-containing protein [Mixta theicola]PNS11095.1 LuxR family transcriptional regulator [Mixta theicola]GLR08444.1 transcriptional activator protein LasR [Mixta theicola]